MRFEGRHFQRIMSPTFCATKQGKIFKHIHFSQRQRARMGTKTPDKLCLPRYSCNLTRCTFYSLRSCSSSDDDRIERQIVGKPTGGAGEGELIATSHPPHRHTKRMDRPTLLEKGPAVKDLRHVRFSADFDVNATFFQDGQKGYWSHPPNHGDFSVPA